LTRDATPNKNGKAVASAGSNAKRNTKRKDAEGVRYGERTGEGIRRAL